MSEMALLNNNLNKLYKADALTFDDKKSSKIYELYLQGKKEKEIIKLIKK